MGWWPVQMAPDEAKGRSTAQAKKQRHEGTALVVVVVRAVGFLIELLVAQFELRAPPASASPTDRSIGSIAQNSIL